MEECNEKKKSLFDKFGMLISGLDTHSLEVSADTLLKVATKGSSRVKKKNENLVFFGYFCETETEEFNQKDWSICHRFGIAIPCSVTYFLEVGAYASLKVAPKFF